MSDSLRPHGLQHARPPKLREMVLLSSCPLNRWYHPTMSSSATLFSFCLQSFPASGSFLVSWVFSSGCQSTGASVSASVISMSMQSWLSFKIDCFDLAVQETLKSLLRHHIWKHQFFSVQPSLWTNTHIPTWLLEKTRALTTWTLLAKCCLCYLICCLGLS